MHDYHIEIHPYHVAKAITLVVEELRCVDELVRVTFVAHDRVADAEKIGLERRHLRGLQRARQTKLRRISRMQHTRVCC